MKFTVKIVVIISIVFLIGFYGTTINAQENIVRSDSIFRSEQYLFKGLSDVIKRYHYDPPLFNDSLSLKIYQAYLKKIDPNKSIFLQEDIDQLAKFQYSIDDEMKGQNSLAFFTEVRKVYKKRLDEIGQYPFFKNANWQPVKGVSILKDYDNLSWAKDSNEKMNRWNNLFSYQYYVKYLELEKGNTNTSIKYQKSKLSLQRKYVHILQNSNEEKDPMIPFAQFVNIVSALLDPHTEYQPPVAKSKFDQMMSNSFYGVGVQLKQNDQGEIELSDLVKGMPAWKSGKIKEGNVLLALAEGVDSTWIEMDGLEIGEIANKIRGKEGSVLRMRIKDGQSGTIENVALTREKINLEQAGARSAILKSKDGKKIGILYLPEFYNDYAHVDGAKSADDVANELKLLNTQGIDALIVDIRNNGGGSLSDVVKIAGYFINSGPVVQVRSRDGNVEVLMDEDPDMLYKGPMAVLVNGNSASASEIFSAAIQDYHRGLIIGADTYGKGTVQRPLPIGAINNGEPVYGAMKLTVQKFYRINGKTTQKNGVKPDIFFPDLYSYFPSKEKNNSSVLSSDSIYPATYTSFNQAFLHKNYRDDRNWMKNDIHFVKMDSIARLASTPLQKVINYDSIKQVQVNQKKLIDAYNTMEKISATTTKKAILPIGAYVDKQWYKEWLNDINSSRIIDKTIEILSSK